MNLSEDGYGHVVHYEGGGVGEDQHVDELEGGPLPTIGFAATTAMVDVHCMAKAKKIMRASAPPRVMSWWRAVCRLSAWVPGSAP